MLYTDGVSEAMTSTEEQFGLERLQAAMADGPGDDARAANQSIFQAVSDFVGDTPASDDITLPDVSPYGGWGMSLTRTVVIETRLAELTRLTEVVENLGEEDDWSPGLVGKVNLVLEELAINTINHGHDGGLHEISFTFSSSDDALTIEMVDDGKPFDPLTEAPVPDVNAPMDEPADRGAGGLPGAEADGRTHISAGRRPQPPDARRLSGGNDSVGPPCPGRGCSQH